MAASLAERRNFEHQSTSWQWKQVTEVFNPNNKQHIVWCLGQSVCRGKGLWETTESWPKPGSSGNPAFPPHTHRHMDVLRVLSLMTFSFSSVDRRSVPLLSTAGTLQSQLSRGAAGLFGPGCCDRVLRPAVRCLAGWTGLVQCWLAQWRICAVPYHQTPRALWGPEHSAWRQELRVLGQR